LEFGSAEPSGEALPELAALLVGRADLGAALGRAALPAPERFAPGTTVVGVASRGAAAAVLGATAVE